MLITFEGLDFSGKSTQAKLLSERLSQENFNVLVLREPGGTEIGEKIRTLLLDKQTIGITDAGELFLFSASRAQLVEEVIRPALDAGLVVVCDRFYDSTTAYQGYGRGLLLDPINAVNKLATGGLAPAATVFLDVPVDEVERRMNRKKSGIDRMEASGLAFYQRVRDGYLQMASKEARFIVIDGMQPVETIHEAIWQRVETLFAQKVKS